MPIIKVEGGGYKAGVVIVAAGGYSRKLCVPREVLWNTEVEDGVWLNDAFGDKFPISWSLGIILAVIGVSVALSLVFPRRATTTGDPNV